MKKNKERKSQGEGVCQGSQVGGGGGGGQDGCERRSEAFVKIIKKNWGGGGRKGVGASGWGSGWM